MAETTKKKTAETKKEKAAKPAEASTVKTAKGLLSEKITSLRQKGQKKQLPENTQNDSKLKQYCRGWLNRFLVLLLPSFIICYTIIFFGPMNIVNSNQMYLTFSAGSIAPSFALATVLATLAIAVVFAFIPGRVRGLALGILVGLAVMIYVQANIPSNLLNGLIPPLDGNTFNWRDIPQQARANLAIWVVVLLVIIVLATRYPEQARFVSLVLCLMIFTVQTVQLLVTWVPEDKSEPNYQLAGDDQYTFSTDENIIFITLDQFSPLLFEEQLEKDPQVGEIFKDFTYYDNMSSCYSFTFPSLMYLGTHQYLDTSRPTREAVYNAWHSDTAEYFYDTLHEQNYKVNLFMESNYAALGAKNMLGKADNVVEAGSLVVTDMFFEFVLDMSLYRYVPIMMKNDYCVSTGGILDLSTYEGVKKLRINYDFRSSLEEEGITLTDDHNVFNWYHLQGAHFPYVVDEEGYWCGEEEDQTDEEEQINRRRQLHGYLIALGVFFDELKESGVYDDATIIISADHGYFECFQVVCMVKLPGETRGAIEVTSAPVAQEDIMPTILNQLGADYSILDYTEKDGTAVQATTVFDWNEGDVRKRTTRVWGHMRNYPEVEWIGNLDQWDAEANGVKRYNVFGVFEYYGDRQDIYDRERYWYDYGVATRIEPLYDSFY